MVNPLEITYFSHTGYSPSDEPASDAVINLNEHWIAQLLLKEYSPGGIQAINVQMSDEELHRVDFLKIRDTVTNERWYYYVVGHKRLNSQVVSLRIVLDAFATVGLSNISFFGNVMRRSLSASERINYPLLPEPWAPRRPLKTRRMIIDLNVNKTIKIPAHISTQFEENISHIEHPENPITIQVPDEPLGLTTTPDSLDFSTDLTMGYPNAATGTSHTITTPWGDIQYTTPYEQYYTLGETALAAFLGKAKKYNALDLVETPYYLPKPAEAQNIILSEVSGATTRNPKASRYYTTITIRSLAANSSRTYADTDTNLQYNQPLTVVIVPDKNGGIYVIPSTLRDTGLNAYTYLDGVYSPFETVMYNAVGDTPAKFAADGTMALNTALNNLFESYTKKINALQYEGMQAKYFKDIITTKGAVLALASEVLGVASTAVTKTKEYVQKSISNTDVPPTTQTGSQTQEVPQYSQTRSQLTTTPGTTAKHYTSSRSIPSKSVTHNTSDAVGSYTQNYGQQTIGSNYMGSYKVDVGSRTDKTTGTTTNSGYLEPAIDTTVTNSQVTQSTTGTDTIPKHTLKTTSSFTTAGYSQRISQDTTIPDQESVTTTTTEGARREVAEGSDIAVKGISAALDLAVDGYDTVKNIIGKGYINEVHSFMLGNINDYLNRWVSVQNDIHNGKVANLFKNVTLVGNYTDYNKLVGKYEILIASLQPEDEANFDLFLDHFGHAVDEYSSSLVADVRENYNYTLVGEDAILTNSILQDASAKILNQFRSGVRVWKKTIKPENY